MSNKKVTFNDNKDKKEESNKRKNIVDINRVKTILSVNPEGGEKEEKNEENKEQPNTKNSNIDKNIQSLSKIKSIKKTLVNSSYRFWTYLGNIEEAEIHRNANIPLKKVGEINEKTPFCKCCNLPCKTDGVVEKYKYSDSTEEFIQNGQAIPLYFSFYIYSIFILSISFLAISLPFLIISYNRSDELNKICNKIYSKNPIEECKIYLDHSDNIEDENQSSFNFILDFSGLNIKNYRIIHEKLTLNENDDIENNFVNFSIINFIGIWTILLIYFGYIILVNNKSYIPNIDILSPKNYSILITGMDNFYSFLRTKTNFLTMIEDSEIKDKNTDGIKESEREQIDEKSTTGVKKFEKLFKEKISELFFSEKQKYNVKKVNICFKINKYIELEEKLEKCNEMVSLIHSPYQKNKNLNVKKSERLYYYSPLSDFNIHLCERTKKLSDIKKEKLNIEKQINDLLEETKEINMAKFAGAVIVSFNTTKEKEEFLNHIPNTLFLKLLKMIGQVRYFFCFCCIDKIDNSKFIMKYLKMEIEEAPNPEDIIFENLEFTQQSKTYRVVGYNMISLLLIGIGFGIILGLQNLQMYVNKKDDNKIIYYLISLCITIVSSIINIIFEELLDMLTKHEKQNSTTDYYLSYSIKLTIFSFLIKGIIPLVAEEILGTTNYEILITNMLTMFLVNSIITPLIWTLQLTPNYWIKKLEKYLIKKNQMKYLNMNQKKLNELYEKSDMNIAEKYSYIAKTLLMTFLYISIFPFGVLISLGGFIICYFLEKYNFINNYKRPEVLNNSLFFFYMRNYVIFIFFIGIGDYIFLSDVYNTKVWSIVNIIFSGILIVIPFNYLLNLDFIGFKESEINKVTYDEAFFEFNEDYERTNPMTEVEGKKNYLEKLSEKNMISKEQKEKFIKDLENINLMKIYYENRKGWSNKKIRISMVSTFHNQQSITKSVNPNAKRYCKLSSIFNSFVDTNKQNKPKINTNQSHMVSPFTKKKKDQGIESLENQGEIVYVNNKKKSDLNRIEEESIQEEEKESEFDNIKQKKKEKKEKKNHERKSEDYNLKKSYNMGTKFKDFYSNSMMYKICGSMQVFNYLVRNEDEDNEAEFFEKEEDDEEEELSIFAINNLDDIEEIESEGGNKKD